MWLLIRGFGLGASLIVAIGAQNAFVLRQGLRREHRLLVALLCSLCDAALIGLGAGGVGSLVSRAPVLTHVLTFAGALFLFAYGLRAFQAARRPGSLTVTTAAPAPLRDVAGTTLALSLLNPHALLDTLVLVGSLSARYDPRPRLLFAVGAVLASFCWFFGLSYGASFLAPLFRRPSAWRVLDLAVGLTVWAIAVSLLLAR